MYLKVINRFFLALSFLTILPLKVKEVNEKKIADSVIFFPLVGLLEGAFCVFLVNILGELLSSSVISIILLLFLFSVRGIMHIDGLSDTFDAIFYKGTGRQEEDIQRRLQIMKDSTVGVAGVLASVMDVICRFVLLKELIDIDQSMILLFIFCFSRWAVIPVMYYGKPVRNTGLGCLFIGKIGLWQFIFASFLPFFLLIYFIFWKNLIFLPLIAIFLLFILFILKGFFEKRFSGLTGDHLGAIIEMAEIFFLFCFLLGDRLWPRL